MWSKHIKEIEAFIKTCELPQTIQINSGEKITNVKKFLDSHLSFVKERNGDIKFKPYMRRLWKVYKMLKNFNNVNT